MLWSCMPLGFGRFVKCSDHRRRNCIIQEFVAKKESERSDRGKRLSGGRCETGLISIWSDLSCEGLEEGLLNQASSTALLWWAKKVLKVKNPISKHYWAECDDGFRYSIAIIAACFTHFVSFILICAPWNELLKRLRSILDETTGLIEMKFERCAWACCNIALTTELPELSSVVKIPFKGCKQRKNCLLFWNDCVLIRVILWDSPLACHQRRHWHRWRSNIATSPLSSRRVTRSSPGAASLSTPTSRGACAARSRSCLAFLQNCQMLIHSKVKFYHQLKYDMIR